MYRYKVKVHNRGNCQERYPVEIILGRKFYTDVFSYIISTRCTHTYTPFFFYGLFGFFYNKTTLQVSAICMSRRCTHRNTHYVPYILPLLRRNGYYFITLRVELIVTVIAGRVFLCLLLYRFVVVRESNLF